MKRSPSTLSSRAPSPRKRLRQQEARRAGHGDHRRMELHELEVAHRRPGRPRQRHAVAGGDRRIGRLAEDAAGAAGGQQRRRGAHLGEPAVAGRSARRRSAPPSTVRATARAPGTMRHAGAGRRALPQHPADLAAGGVAGVKHPAHAVRALAAEREGAAGVAIERRAPLGEFGDQAAGPPRRARGRLRADTGRRRRPSCRRRGATASRRRRRRRRCRPGRTRCCSRRAMPPW